MKRLSASRWPRPSPCSRLIDLFEQRHSEEFVWRADITLPDGRVLQGQLSPLPGVGYGAVLRDITRLKELDRIKSEFVSIVSHDLRTPLTAIRGYVSLLPRVGPLTDMQQDFVARVERSMDSIVDLIADLLDIGKIEAGVDWEMTPVPLHDGGARGRGATAAQGRPASANLDGGRARSVAGAGQSAAAGTGGGEPHRQRHQIHARSADALTVVAA